MSKGDENADTVVDEHGNQISPVSSKPSIRRLSDSEIIR